MLTEVFGFSNVAHDDLDHVCDKFEEELENYFKSMIVTMAYSLFWRRAKANANLNNIKISKLFTMERGSILVDDSESASLTRIEYIHRSAGVTWDPTADISVESADFSKSSTYRKFVRGKYVLWFLVEFCNSVYKASDSFFSTADKPPKKKVPVSVSNAVIIIGNRARIPSTLRSFLPDTYCNYISNRNSFLDLQAIGALRCHSDGKRE